MNKLSFMAGVLDYDDGISLEEAIQFVKEFENDLLSMAYYDGYIRRKHGLVDENGEEIF